MHGAARPEGSQFYFAKRAEAMVKYQTPCVELIVFWAD